MQWVGVDPGVNRPINSGVAAAPGGTPKPDTLRGEQVAGVANMASAPAQRLTGAAGIAQHRIEQDGYKNARNLQMGADGLWHGTAMRGNTQVQVSVDRAGRVSAL